jgi:hypothetical protein
MANSTDELITCLKTKPEALFELVKETKKLDDGILFKIVDDTEVKIFKSDLTADMHTALVGKNGLLVTGDCTEEMATGFDDAISIAKSRGITDADELMRIGQAAADASGDLARFASGARRSALNILSHEEIAFIKSEFEAIGGDPSKLVFNQGGGTCYVDELDQIFIRGDVFPLEDAAHPRSTMSPRAVLAHEYYGHAANAGTPVPAGMWNDEFRASYMAAKNAPNLTDIDRYNLIQDAITRAQEAGVTIELNDFMRSILYGY